MPHAFTCCMHTSVHMSMHMAMRHVHVRLPAWHPAVHMSMHVAMAMSMRVSMSITNHHFFIFTVRVFIIITMNALCHFLLRQDDIGDHGTALQRIRALPTPPGLELGMLKHEIHASQAVQH